MSYVFAAVTLMKQASYFSGAVVNAAMIASCKSLSRMQIMFHPDKFCVFQATDDKKVVEDI